MSNYPPGVTGAEPQITGDYGPCPSCGDTSEEECHMCSSFGTHEGGCQHNDELAGLQGLAGRI